MWASMKFLPTTLYLILFFHKVFSIGTLIQATYYNGPLSFGKTIPFILNQRAKLSLFKGETEIIFRRLSLFINNCIIIIQNKFYLHKMKLTVLVAL